MIFDLMNRCYKKYAEPCDNIPYNETKYNLYNAGLPLPTKSSRTILHCDCDEGLRECFRVADEKYANVSGEYYYFGIAPTSCFKKEYPIVKCVEYDVDDLWGDRCMHYELDKSKSKIYQLFDLPIYYDWPERLDKTSLPGYPQIIRCLKLNICD